MHTIRFPYKLDLSSLLVTVVITLTACSTSIPFRPEERPTELAADSLSHPTRIPTPRATDVPQVLPTTTATSTTLPRIDLEAFEVELTLNVNSSDDYVVRAFWSDAGELVYYAFVPCCDTKSLEWAAYDTTTRLTTTVSSPLRYDPGIWQRLSVPNPLDSTGLYPELAGYISPSGRHVIFPVSYGDPLDPTARTEIWLADADNLSKVKLLEVAPRVIHQVAWFEGETGAIFNLGTHGATDLYVADIKRGTVVPLAEVSAFGDPTEEKWALSPDGTTLAVTGRQASLWLISLEDGQSTFVSRNAIKPYWSQDGRSLYYWWGSTFNEIGTLQVYDVTSKHASTVVSKDILEEAFPGISGSDYAVSPKRDKFVFWGGWLLVVDLHK